MKSTSHVRWFVGAFVAWTALAGENWPQWRGPRFDGSTAAKNLPATLSKDEIRWACPVPGRSGATPIVWGDHVFVSSPD